MGLLILLVCTILVAIIQLWPYPIEIHSQQVFLNSYPDRSMDFSIDISVLVKFLLTLAIGLFLYGIVVGIVASSTKRNSNAS